MIANETTIHKSLVFCRRKERKGNFQHSTSGAMPTSVVHYYESMQERWRREMTFALHGPCNLTEKKFASDGFFKLKDDLVECFSCGNVKDVDLSIEWRMYEISRLHRACCDVKRNSTYSSKVIEIAVSMGFSSDIIINAGINFFKDFGSFPDIDELMEYIASG